MGRGGRLRKATNAVVTSVNICLRRMSSRRTAAWNRLGGCYGKANAAVETWGMITSSIEREGLSIVEVFGGHRNAVCVFGANTLCSRSQRTRDECSIARGNRSCGERMAAASWMATMAPYIRDLHRVVYSWDRIGRRAAFFDVGSQDGVGLVAGRLIS